MTYIFKKDCRNIGKEVGDYYNGEYGTDYQDLMERGIIEKEELEPTEEQREEMDNEEKDWYNDDEENAGDWKYTGNPELELLILAKSWLQYLKYWKREMANISQSVF